MIIILLIVGVFIVYEHKNFERKAYLDEPKINTCSTEDGMVNLQIRYFTNHKLDTMKYQNLASFTGDSTGISINNQSIEFSEQVDGVYVYFIHLNLKFTTNQASYNIQIKLDKDYFLENLTNVNYEEDKKNLAIGMDIINVYHKDMTTRLGFDENSDINNIQVNNVLNEITKNEVKKDKSSGDIYIEASGNIKNPQIVGYTYTYKNKTYCAGNEIQYKDVTTKDIKRNWK